MGNKNKKEQQSYLNNIMEDRRSAIFNRLHNKYFELAKSNFETDLNYKQWDYVFKRFWKDGKVGCFLIPFIEESEDDVLAKQNIGFAQIGSWMELDMYYNPEYISFVNSKNFKHIPKGLQRVDDQACIGYITADRNGLWSHIEPLVKDLVDIEQILYLNLLMQKCPMLIALDDGSEIEKAQEITSRLLLTDTPIIFAEGMNPALFKSASTGATFIADKLMNLYNDKEAQILTFLGINNSGINKVEQVQLSEVHSNDETINLGDDQFDTELKGFTERCKKALGVDFYIRAKKQNDANGDDGEFHNMEEKSGPKDYLAGEEN